MSHLFLFYSYSCEKCVACYFLLVLHKLLMVKNHSFVLTSTSFHLFVHTSVFPLFPQHKCVLRSALQLLHSTSPFIASCGAPQRSSSSHFGSMRGAKWPPLWRLFFFFFCAAPPRDHLASRPSGRSCDVCLL